MSYTQRVAEYNEEREQISKKFKPDDKVEIIIKVGEEIFEIYTFNDWSNVDHWKAFSKATIKVGWKLRRLEIMNRYEAETDEKKKEQILEEYKRVFYATD